MSSRGRDGDGGVPRGDPNEPPKSSYPLLFKANRPGAPQGFVDRIRALFRTTMDTEDPEGAVPPPVADDLEPDDPIGVSSEADPQPPSPRTATPVPIESPGPRGPTAPALQGEDPEPVALHRATLQMLPGRLQPLDWKVVAQEIRFLRPTNAEQGVTLGSDRADPPDHITIIHPSVEARHAQMRYKQGEWWIESLAGEAPVRVNDRPVGMRRSKRLSTGDRLGIGDVEFRYMGT